MQTFLITHQDAAPASALTNPDRIPKIIPKISSPRGGLLAGEVTAACVGVGGIGAIIR